MVPDRSRPAESSVVTGDSYLRRAGELERRELAAGYEYVKPG